MISKSDLKKPLNSLSTLRREEVLKYKRAQEEERLAVLGQESEIKALPWIQDDVDREQKKETDYFYLIMDLLHSHRNKKVPYFRILTQVFLRFMAMEQIPKKYFIDIETNDIGIKVEIKNTKYYGAFKVCGLPSYDFRACQILAIKLGNTIAKLEGHYQKSHGGMILPDQEDLKVYG